MTRQLRSVADVRFPAWIASTCAAAFALAITPYAPASESLPSRSPVLAVSIAKKSADANASNHQQEQLIRTFRRSVDESREASDFERDLLGRVFAKSVAEKSPEIRARLLLEVAGACHALECDSAARQSADLAVLTISAEKGASASARDEVFKHAVAEYLAFGLIDKAEQLTALISDRHRRLATECQIAATELSHEQTPAGLDRLARIESQLRPQDSDILAQVVLTYAEAADMDRALVVMERGHKNLSSETVGVSIRFLARSDLAIAYAKLGHLEKTLQMLAEQQELADKPIPYSSSVATETSLSLGALGAMRALIERGQPQDATKMLAFMPNAQIRADAYLALARCQPDNNPAGVIDYFMDKAYSSAKRSDATIERLAQLAESWHELKRTSKALSALAEAHSLTMNLPKDDLYRDARAKAVGICAARIGASEMAYEIASLLQSGPRGEVRMELAKAAIRLGRIDVALAEIGSDPESVALDEAISALSLAARDLPLTERRAILKDLRNLLGERLFEPPVATALLRSRVGRDT